MVFCFFSISLSSRLAWLYSRNHLTPQLTILDGAARRTEGFRPFQWLQKDLNECTSYSGTSTESDLQE
ncbi:hypothetical protein AOXY_G5334 [Acipenser oxyrinchus oxyrinchus]|uniref:Uncharacterized protein n=1 Tax=Acipenser oxyrinchus oxyrinchus TaxID=40147 RepID=A0AAD8GED5_ACIOX|nr:hypothetical protein AOXY_G5334 [Acipenser oxyrinchus oxyrinchus]